MTEAVEGHNEAVGNARLHIWRTIRMVLVHVLLFATALFLSFLVFHRMKLDRIWLGSYLHSLAWVLFVKLIVFGLFHQYQSYWRYVSVSDLLAIIKASHFSTLIIIGVPFVASNLAGLRLFRPLIYEERGVFESIMLMDWAATIVVICGVRLAIRLYFEETETTSGARLTRLLIVGAGNAGEGLLREIRRMPVAEYDVVGFVDDNPKKWRARIHGVPVLGPTTEIREIARKRNVDEIAIAIPSASHRELRKVIGQCEGTNLRFSTVPDLVDIAAGKVNVSQMRDVDINDLLGRDPVQLDQAQISEFVRNKVVLITGAGGSIGSEMCRQVGPFQPKLLLLLEQAENGLFFVERELRRSFPGLNILAVIADCADVRRIDHVFEKFRPDVVIHAAAHKHVPLMELNPGEAVKNNVLGTRNVAEAADRHGASNFVMISTDKAVNPTSIMGSSKRVAEMVIQCLNNHSETDYVTVRFGNVLGSNGSVIPIFRQQIAQGGPVTVTHPEMQRYFMTIPEASQLVLQAAAMGRGGEVFVLDMGEPVKIVDLARDLITLSGFRVGEDIEIKFTGIRPGEKLFEELAIRGENMVETRHPKIFIWRNVPTEESTLCETISELVDIADADSHDRIIALIKRLVPEYVGDVDHEQLRADYLAARGKANGNGNGVDNTQGKTAHAAASPDSSGKAAADS